jgi:hypothetical protein
MFARIFYVHLLDDHGYTAMVLIRAYTRTGAVEKAVRKYPDHEFLWVEG